MGLDVYAVRSLEIGLTEEDARAIEEAGIELCGGIYSGDNGSFEHLQKFLDVCTGTGWAWQEAGKGEKNGKTDAM